jgi:hypothetical protein
MTTSVAGKCRIKVVLRIRLSENCLQKLPPEVVV